MRRRLTKVPRRYADRLPSVISVPAPQFPGPHNHTSPRHISVRNTRSPIWRFATTLDAHEPWAEINIEFYPEHPSDQVGFLHPGYATNVRHQPGKFILLSTREAPKRRFLDKKVPDHKHRSGRGLHFVHAAAGLRPFDPVAASFLRVASRSRDVHDFARSLAAYQGTFQYVPY